MIKLGIPVDRGQHKCRSSAAAGGACPPVSAGPDFLISGGRPADHPAMALLVGPLREHAINRCGPVVPLGRVGRLRWIGRPRPLFHPPDQKHQSFRLLTLVELLQEIASGTKGLALGQDPVSTQASSHCPHGAARAGLPGGPALDLETLAITK